jgi:hypothetical protein
MEILLVIVGLIGFGLFWKMLESSKSLRIFVGLVVGTIVIYGAYWFHEDNIRVAKWQEVTNKCTAIWPLMSKEELKCEELLLK